MKKETPENETVRVSTDYDRFISHGQQRQIKAYHVKRLMASMKSLGFIASSPIAVTNDAGKLRIIDGHHRHAAAKALKIPLYYILMPGGMSSAVGVMNIGSAWTSVEWANKYALDGMEHYLTLKKYVARGIPMGLAAAMLAGNNADTGNTTLALVSGQFKVKTTDAIDVICDIKAEFAGICPAVATRSFISAFSMCYPLPEFKVAQFKARLTARPRALVKMATKVQMLSLLESIYNHASQVKVPLAFLAQTASAARNAKKPKKDA